MNIIPGIVTRNNEFLEKISNNRIIRLFWNVNFFQGIFFSLLLLFKQMVFTEWFHYDPKLFIFLISISLILVSWTFLVGGRKQFLCLLAINVLVTLLIVADRLYFRYYSTVVSIPVLMQAGAIGATSKSIISLFKRYDILYISDFVFFIPVSYFILYKIKLFSTAMQRINYRICLFVIALLCSSGFMWYNVYKLDKDVPGIFTSVYDNNLLVERMGILTFHAFDSYNFFNSTIMNKDKITRADKENIIQFFKEKEKNRGTGLFGTANGKNLIIIQVEALQNFVINSRVGGVEVTPNLNRFINESIYFDNYYTQVHGGNTSDAEFMTNTSLYPVKEGAVYFRYPGNIYNSLPKLLKEQGYFTAAMHGYNGSFWNRTNMYKTLGFDRFFSNKDYVIDEIRGWGISDRSFLRQTLEKLTNMQKPFYSFIITLSSHHPFVDFENDESLDVGDFKATQVGDYLKAIRYADDALGQFLDGLKQKGFFENSIIVIYGDHDAIKSDNHDILDKFLGNEKDDVTRAQYYKVPLIVHIPGQSLKGTRNMPGGQIDLMPTLLNLFGIGPEYCLGNDLFNIKENSVIFRNLNYTDGNVFYLSSKNEWYDLKTHELLNGDLFSKEYDESVKMLRISDQVISNDFIKQFK